MKLLIRNGTDIHVCIYKTNRYMNIKIYAQTTTFKWLPDHVLYYRRCYTIVIF